MKVRRELSDNGGVVGEMNGLLSEGFKHGPVVNVRLYLNINNSVNYNYNSHEFLLQIIILERKVRQRLLQHALESFSRSLLYEPLGSLEDGLSNEPVREASSLIRF